MVGVFETDCEGFVGLDDGLVEGDVVNDGEGTLEFLAPCDVALGLSVATYRADTNLIGILTSGEGSFHYVVCPRGGGGHEGLHIALAEPDFVIPGSDFLVIDGTAFVLCRAGAGEKFRAKDMLRMAAAHTDYPCMRIKPHADFVTNRYAQINVEVYGGPILNTWFDRPLGGGCRCGCDQGCARI